MQGLESLVWVFAFLAGVVFMLVQFMREVSEKRAREARQREMARQEQAQAQAQQEPETPSAQDWGRAPARHERPAAEPLELEPVTPERVVLELPPRVPPAPVPPARLPVEPHVHVPLQAPVHAPLSATIERRPPADRPPIRRQRFRTPAEVREGIIAMTVLGPCRALAPYGEDQR